MTFNIKNLKKIVGISNAFYIIKEAERMVDTIWLYLTENGMAATPWPPIDISIDMTPSSLGLFTCRFYVAGQGTSYYKTQLPIEVLSSPTELAEYLFNRM